MSEPCSLQGLEHHNEYYRIYDEDGVWTEYMVHLGNLDFFFLVQTVRGEHRFYRNLCESPHSELLVKGEEAISRPWIQFMM